MDKKKLTVSWDDLKSEEVDQKIKRQEALSQVQAQYRTAPAPEALYRHKRTSIWYNTIFHMSLFGLVGGLLGWGCGELFSLRPDRQFDAQRRLVEYKEWKASSHPEVAERIKAENQSNPYFAVEFVPGITPAEKQSRLKELAKQDQWKSLVGNVLFYGTCGLMIALSLGSAEAIVQRNVQGAIINGSIGAMLGLLGGVAVAFIVDRIEHALIGNQADAGIRRRFLANALSWGVLGMFLSMGPGLVMRNTRKLLIGLAGGLIGGLLGGVLFDPVASLVHSDSVSRLVAVLAIGLITGFGTGLIENVAKTGWLKVTEGIITGKQFVLYRNPTYLGSSPHCQIYLFKDAQVGKRHAAVHIIPGGFEVENLPLGGPTLVNGQPVTRTRLKTGDRIQIGSTTLLFNEKVRKD